MKSIVLQSFLKQKANQLQKEKSLDWHQALDETSKEFGYTNYKNYLNILAANRQQLMFNKELLLKNISSENNMFKKIDLAASFIKNNLIPFTDLVWILEPFKHSKALQSVCEKANLKEDIKSCILQDFLSDEGKSHLMKFYQNYREKKISLGNLIYKMNTDKICINGLFELILEFNFEAPNSNSVDRSLFGTFDMTIDHKDITMAYSCDHNFKEMCHAGSKTYFNYYSQ